MQILQQQKEITNDFGMYVKNNSKKEYTLKITVPTEHAIIIDNQRSYDKIRNDPKDIDRKEPIKGYKSDGWNGGLNVPGFIFPDATVYEWTA